MAALFVLLSGCTRPQGTTTLRNISPSPSPVAAHEPLTITDVAMHNGEVGLAFAPITLAATGGVTPYHWTVSVGSLPGGLALSPDGVISGTPTSNGFFQFGVQVFDADSDTAGLPRTIGIVPQLTAALVPSCATECDVELGCVTVCGTFGQVSGGASPLTYKLTSGPLPSGTSLSGMSLKGTFTGLPGRLSFAVQVTDAFGTTASLTPTFNLIPHISFGGSALCSGDYNKACSATLSYSGGTPGGTPKVNVVGYAPYCVTFCYSNPMTTPQTFNAQASGGTVTVTVQKACGYVPGSVTGCPNGWGVIVYMNLTDQSLCSSGMNCTSPGKAAFSIVIVGG
jgi:hypothetical protein